MKVNIRRLTVVGAIVLSFFCHAGCVAQTVTQKADTLEQEVKRDDPYLWDFGRVTAGTIQRHDFLLKNESDKTLTITGTQTSCGCTGSQVEKKVLEPQESTAIKVQFNSKDYSGPVQQYVYVNTDDIDRPVIKYIIKAEVEAEGAQEHKPQERKN